MTKNKMKLGLSLLTVLATPIAVNAVVSNDAQAAQGWVKTGNAWYFYNQKGALVRNSWAGSYWLGADGKMATNAWVDNGRYYVGANGAWVKGSQNQATATQNQVTSKATKQGWVQSGNAWYYYNNGSLVVNKWVGNYWLGADGRMVTNAWVDNGRYYVGANGAWVKDAKRPEEKKQGWVKEANTWYYYNTDGTLARNKWARNYWLGADGRMATNRWVDNNRYYVGNDGAWVKDAKRQEEKKTGWVKEPQYYQGDYRWRNKRFGIGTMAQSGCAPTSLAMVFSGLGQKVLPTSVAEMIYNHTNEMNVRELGTSGKGVVYAINAYGYSHSVITSKEQLIAALQSGKPVFAAVGNGIFARGGLTHAIVLSGYSNGKTKAMDPDNVNTTGRWYDVNTIWNQRSTDPYDNNIGGPFVQIG